MYLEFGEYLINKNSKLINDKTDTILIGDSYFELLQYEEVIGYNFNEIHKNVANFGIGGATFFDYLKYIKLLKENRNIKKVYVNLGINDINGDPLYRKEEMIKYAIELKDEINKLYPNSTIYFLTIIHSPYGYKNRIFEIEFNKEIINNDLFNVIDISRIINTNDSLFQTDLLHLNQKGYELFIDELIKNGL